MSQRIMPTGLDPTNLVWRKARRSTNDGACVEIASVVGEIALRDSKDPSGPILVYTSGAFSAFIEGVKKGEFDDLEF